MVLSKPQMNKKNIIKQIKEVIAALDNTATAILFGSRARGNEKEDSDWDILILLPKEKVTLKDEQLFRHKLYELELKIEMPISAFVYPLHDWNTKLKYMPLHRNIDREGLIL